MRLISLFIVSVTLGCLTALLYLYGLPPNAQNTPSTGSVQPSRLTPPDTSAQNTEPTQKENRSAQGNINTSVKTTSPQLAASKTHYILRFKDMSARESFLAINSLSYSDLTPIPELNAYVTQARNLITSPGTTLYANQGYRATLTPTDPLASGQWHLARVKATNAWNHQVGSNAVTTAVIDTGFALTHEDLTQAWAHNTGETGPALTEGAAPNCTSRGLALDKNCNNIDDDSDGYIDNSLGWDFMEDSNNVQAGKTNPAGSGVSHGTMTTGLIAAGTNNAKGDAGMNWNARVLPLQALDDDGNGTTVSVSLAVRYAVDHGARIINLSLGGNSDDPILAEQINYALTNNVVIVAAAGNDGCNCMSYPAAYSGVISVGATNTTNTRASFSSFGNRLDIMAPGTSICSTTWAVAQPTNSYVCGVAGTSFSAPITAGVVSLLVSQNSSLTPDQVRNAIITSATKLPEMNGANWTATYGYGLLDTYAALAKISLTKPGGQPLNTRTVKLSQINSGPFAYLAENLNSTCESILVTALCRLRAINTTTNQMIALSTNEAATGLTYVDWQASTSGLTAGQWLIQSYVTLNGAQSLAREETLTISP